MADHRALQAVKAVRDILIAAETRAGSNVEIGRAANIDEGDAIDINIGDDVPVNERGIDNTATIDSYQRVYIDCHTRGGDHEETILTRAFDLRAQVHAALMADWTLGLSFVIAVIYAGAEPILSESQGDRLGSIRTVWDINYRMNYANPAT